MTIFFFYFFIITTKTQYKDQCLQQSWNRPKPGLVMDQLTLSHKLNVYYVLVGKHSSIKLNLVLLVFPMQIGLLTMCFVQIICFPNGGKSEFKNVKLEWQIMFRELLLQFNIVRWLWRQKAYIEDIGARYFFCLEHEDPGIHLI